VEVHLLDRSCLECQDLSGAMALLRREQRFDNLESFSAQSVPTTTIKPRQLSG